MGVGLSGLEMPRIRPCSAVFHAKAHEIRPLRPPEALEAPKGGEARRKGHLGGCFHPVFTYFSLVLASFHLENARFFSCFPMLFIDFP